MERSAVAWEDYLDAEQDAPRGRRGRTRPKPSRTRHRRQESQHTAAVEPGKPAAPSTVTSSTRRRRRVTVSLLAVLAVGAVAVSAATLLAPATAPERTTTATQQPPAAAAQPAAPDTATAAPAAPDATAWTWTRTGLTLPVSPTAGPARLADLAAGFARTELGAALAAAHLSVRVDPAAGPDVYRPTIEQQMTGDTARVLAAVDAAATPAAGTSAQQTAPTITGYRIEDYTPDAATVHLLVASPGGGTTDFAVPVAWDATKADWLLVAPAADAADLFATTPPTGDYTEFLPQETP